ncbi:MAG: chromosomal protein MC1 [Candidatus Micrarchaeota archaeon]|nr:chromosomal protein MC1 [Candidatus Micrarchaeota archaeon]
MAKRKAKKKAAAKKYYVLKVGRKTAIFTGAQPRQAALKAATRGFKDIKLRERGRRNKDGTYTIHIFKGSRKQVKAPSNAPDWLPKKVWKPVVKKVGVNRVAKI